MSRMAGRFAPSGAILRGVSGAGRPWTASPIRKQLALIPGSERMIPILREAAPCIVLLDEVVAFARQLRGVEYDAFHAFMQSLTEAAAAVDGAVVVGSLPESGAEVGDEQGIHALRRLEKIFGRVQSAWMPASGIETFEIVRRRLFQPLDSAGEKVRDETLRVIPEALP